MWRCRFDGVYYEYINPAWKKDEVLLKSKLTMKKNFKSVFVYILSIPFFFIFTNLTL